MNHSFARPTSRPTFAHWILVFLFASYANAADNPGQIKVVLIRETRAVDFAR